MKVSQIRNMKISIDLKEILDNLSVSDLVEYYGYSAMVRELSNYNSKRALIEELNHDHVLDYIGEEKVKQWLGGGEKQ
jgi:hypothetical protein